MKALIEWLRAKFEYLCELLVRTPSGPEYTPEPIPTPLDRIADMMVLYKAENCVIPCTLGTFGAFLRNHGVISKGLAGELRARGAKSTLVAVDQDNAVRMWSW